ncbi:MAG: MFS transporter [Burkholderiales bacterium]
MNPTLVALAVANFAVGTGGLVIAGVLNQIADDLTVSVAQAGQLIAVYALAYAVGAPLLSAVAGMLDRKRVLVIGMLLFGLGAVLAAIAPSYFALMAVRVLMACGAALITPTSLAVAGFLTDPAQRGKAMSLVFGGFAIANVIGVPLGAWVGGHFGWRMSLWMVAGFLLVALGFILRKVPRGIKVPPTTFTILFSTLLDWRKQLLILLVALQMGSIFVIYTYIAPLLKSEISAGATMITVLLFWFGALAVAGTFAAGSLVVRLGVARVMAASIVLLILSHLGLSLLRGSLWMTLVVLAVWAVSGFAFQPAQQTRLVNADPKSANAMLALNASALYAGQAAGAWLGGRVIDYAGLVGLGWVGALGALGTLIAFAWSLKAERSLAKDTAAAGATQTA